MSKPLYYIETSVISYLANRLSRDMLTGVRQTLTHEWWETVPKEQMRISSLVLQEIGRGHPVAAANRMTFAKSIEILDDHAEQDKMAMRLVNEKLVPETETEDALHIAQAVLNRCQYIVTWNFSHFVGFQPRLRLNLALHAWGFDDVYLVTPEELLEVKQNGH